jgi:solute carrier family 35 protein
MLSVWLHAHLQAFSLVQGTVRPVGNSGFVTLRALRASLPLAFSFLVYVSLSMASLRGVNLAMFTTLRRTTSAFTLVAEYFLTGERATRAVLGSITLVITGAIIAGLGDLQFNMWGYGLVLACNASTAVYLATISRLGKSTGLNSFGLMWVNTVFSAPSLLLFCWLQGSILKTVRFFANQGYACACLICASCILAFALNYFVFLNTTLNSALTQTVCGNVKVRLVSDHNGLFFCTDPAWLPNRTSFSYLWVSSLCVSMWILRMEWGFF